MTDTFKPILVLDFDGVIHSYESGWKGADVIPDPPVPGAFEALSEYIKYFKVHIFSSRSHQPGGIEAMIRWFIEHDFEDADALVFPLEKPPAKVTIDDRAITFTGTFPPVETLQNFQPWNRQKI